MPALTVEELARISGGEVEGDATHLIAGANTLDSAAQDEAAFVDSDKAFAEAARSRAGCLIVPVSFENGERVLIRSKNPRLAFVQILRALYPEMRQAYGVHSSAIVAASAVIGANCSIGPYVTIGENVQFGEGCAIAAGCRVGDDVRIGPNTIVHPNVTIYARARIGTRCVIHAGCVIGADGFGFLFAGDHYEKFPQVGTVEIGDDVEIGANTCIDRAALGTTRIGDGTKLDNLVHIAHNCTLGKHVVVAAQTGFSGSVTVGDYAMIGGQAGIGEKARIDAKSVVGGKAGVLTGQRVRAGEPVWGIPARPLKQHLRNLAHVSRLPRASEELADMRKRLEKLEARD